MDHRQQALMSWAKAVSPIQSPTWEALAGDASFRRYFRIGSPDISYVVMDAPPGQEKCEPFIEIADALRQQGVLTPEIFASDLANGFLLLSDFGDTVLLNALTPDNADALYTKALTTLSVLQSCRSVVLPDFTADFMFNELLLFQEWFLEKHLKRALSHNNKKMLHDFFRWLTNTISHQPTVFMHRDYHSANLMVLPSGQIGVLDFQDAFRGPVTYDVVSLLRDCYIAWPTESVTRWALQYRDQVALKVSNDEFLAWFDLMGLQRHLKALLTFSRKYRRDHNDHYLKHIPPALHYIMTVSACYPECKNFSDFIGTILPCAV